MNNAAVNTGYITFIQCVSSRLQQFLRPSLFWMTLTMLRITGQVPQLSSHFRVCGLKKQCATWELWVKFYLGQNEDCSPGDSISESSEKLLRRGGGKVSTYGFWWRVRGSMPSSTHYCRRFLLVTRSRRHHEGFQCFSRYEELQELGS